MCRTSQVIRDLEITLRKDNLDPSLKASLERKLNKVKRNNTINK